MQGEERASLSFNNRKSKASLVRDHADTPIVARSTASSAQKVHKVRNSTSISNKKLLTTSSPVRREQPSDENICLGSPALANHKVADLIKNADLYDLISMSLRTSDMKSQAVDKYIQRAIDRKSAALQIQLKDEAEVAEAETAPDEAQMIKLRSAKPHRKTASNASSIAPQEKSQQSNAQIQSPATSENAAPTGIFADKRGKSQSSIINITNNMPLVGQNNRLRQSQDFDAPNNAALSLMSRHSEVRESGSSSKNTSRPPSQLRQPTPIQFTPLSDIKNKVESKPQHSFVVSGAPSESESHNVKAFSVCSGTVFDNRFEKATSLISEPAPMAHSSIPKEETKPELPHSSEIGNEESSSTAQLVSAREHHQEEESTQPIIVEVSPTEGEKGIATYELDPVSNTITPQQAAHVESFEEVYTTEQKTIKSKFSTLMQAESSESKVVAAQNTKSMSPMRVEHNFNKPTKSSVNKVKQQPSLADKILAERKTLNERYDRRMTGPPSTNVRSVSTNVKVEARDRSMSQNRQIRKPLVTRNIRDVSADRVVDSKRNYSTLNINEVRDSIATHSALENYETKKKVAPEDEMQPNKVAALLLKKQESKKIRMVNSFNALNLGIFIELDRIKKPQRFALQAGKMICMLANAFREKPSSNPFDEWTKIRQFINTNVNKFTHDVLGLRFKVLDNQWLKTNPQVIERLGALKEEFFSGNNSKFFKQLASNKNLKIIVYFVYNVISFIWETLGLNYEEYESKTPECDVSAADGTKSARVARPEISCSVSDISGNQSAIRTGAETSRGMKKASDLSPFRLNEQKTARADSKRDPINLKQKQVPKKNVSPKPKFATRTNNTSPLRVIKNKFCANYKGVRNPVAGLAEMPKSTQNVAAKSTSQEKKRAATPNERYTQKNQIQPATESRKVSRGRASVSPVKKPSVVVSPAKPISANEVSPLREEMLVEPCELSIKESRIDADPMETEMKEITTTFDYSLIVESQCKPLNRRIIDTAKYIEENMRLPTRGRVDMNVIEELKLRRQQKQRQTEQQLDETREAVIAQIQAMLDNDKK